MFDDEANAEVVDLAAWLARPTWMGRAACRGLARRDHIFFPTQGETTAPAKAICRGCPVRFDCLDYAMVMGEKYGIWGGLSEPERGRLRRKVRPTLPPPATPNAADAQSAAWLENELASLPPLASA